MRRIWTCVSLVLAAGCGARSLVGTGGPPPPPDFACPTAAIRTIPGNLTPVVVPDGTLLVSSEHSFEVESGPPGVAAQIAVDGPGRASFVAQTPGSYVVDYEAHDPTFGTFMCRLNIHVLEDAPVARCASAELLTSSDVPLLVAATSLISAGTLVTLFRITSAPPSGDAVLMDVDIPDATSFHATVPGLYTLEFIVESERGDTDSCTITVSVVPPRDEPEARCEGVLLTVPLTRLSVVGMFSAVPDMSLTWSVLSRPVGSTAILEDVENERAFFTPDIVGEYMLEFVVIDGRGRRASCQTAIRAVATEGLRVEMFWLDDVTDLDLHLLHPSASVWFHPTKSCYWLTCYDGIAWDGPTERDDARLDIDDRRGLGPENINIDEPVAQTYRIGVHAYAGEILNPQPSWPGATAIVRVYCGGNSIHPVYESAPMSFPNRKDFWRVADVTTSTSGCTVTPIDSVTPQADAQSRR